MTEEGGSAGGHAVPPDDPAAVAWVRAAAAGDVGRLCALRDAGVDADALDDVGDTALMAAAAHGELAAAVALLGWGADVSRRRPTMTAARADGWYRQGGDTALHLAVRAGHADIAEALLAHGADVDAAEDDGWTPLMAAARSCRPALVALLLDHGADVTLFLSRDGPSALMLASAQRSDAGRAATTVSLLLARGTDPNARNKWGVTALMWAAQFGSVENARILLDHGALLEARDRQGSTPLMYAAKSPHAAGDSDTPGIVRLLLARGADLGAQNGRGQTVVDLAEKAYRIKTKRAEIVAKRAEIVALLRDGTRG